MNDELQHFGVLGMKWGRRKGATQADEDRWVKKAMSRETYVKVHNRMSARLNNVEISRINNKPEYKGKNFNLPENKKLFAKYNKEFADTVLRIANEEMNSIVGPSPLGRKIVISDGGNGTTVYSLEEIKHEDGLPVFVAKRDANGMVISLEIKSDGFVQEDDDDGLKHFGVLGMKWGVRRNRTGKGITDSKVFKAMIYDKDQAILSKKGREKFMNEFNSSAAKGKSVLSKLSNTTLFKQTVFNKDTSLLTEAGRSAAKAKLRGVVEKLERASVRGQDRDIALSKEIVAGYKAAEAKGTVLHPRDKKIMREHEEAIKFMEDELNSLYTPEELKRLREN